MFNRSPKPSDDARDRPSYDPAAERVPETQQLRIDDADAEVTEEEAAVIAEGVAATAVRRRIRPLEALMLVMLAISLLIHALTISRLFSIRNTLRNEITLLAESVQAAKEDKVRYDLPIDEQIPIDIDVPIKRSLNIPINTEVRIKQDIVLPVETGFGNLNIPIPIDTTIPINTTVPIEFDQTVNISTSVPLKLNVPIEVDLGSPQVSGYLDRLHDKLLELRDKF